MGTESCPAFVSLVSVAFPLGHRQVDTLPELVHLPLVGLGARVGDVGHRLQDGFQGGVDGVALADVLQDDRDDPHFKVQHLLESSLVLESETQSKTHMTTGFSLPTLHP